MTANETDEFEEVEFTDDELRDGPRRRDRYGEEIGAGVAIETTALEDAEFSVADMEGCVSLRFAAPNGLLRGKAWLTADRARHLADELTQAADRLDDA